MNIPTDILIYVVSGLFSLICWFFKIQLIKIHETQANILDEVRRTNGRLIAVETRVEEHYRDEARSSTEHNRNDDERFRSIHERIGELSERVNLLIKEK